MAETRVLGLDDLKTKFRQLPVDISKKVLRKGASAGAKVIKAAEIAGAPVAARPHRKGVPVGVLKRAAIIKFVRSNSTDDQATYIVTFRQGKKQQKNNRDAYYAKWVERGHRIVPRKAVKRTRKQKRAAATGQVAGLHFFANALRASQDKALTAMVNTMSAEVKKVIP